MAIKPEELLRTSVGKPVAVTLKNGEEYKGILRSYDEFINIVLEVEGGRTLIFKGSKIMLIAPQ
jgi:small nuclear ribonucleoprotein (snRNP)-like protein